MIRTVLAATVAAFVLGGCNEPPANRGAQEPDCCAIDPQELEQARMADPRSAIHLGAAGQVGPGNALRECDRTWDDLAGNRERLASRDSADVRDFMQRGLNACEAFHRYASEDPSFTTPQCARYADASVAALRQFTTAVDLTDEAQAGRSRELIEGVRIPQAVCAATRRGQAAATGADSTPR